MCLAAAIWKGSDLFVAGNGTTIGNMDYNGSIRKLDAAAGTPVWETGLPGSVLGSPSMNGAGVIALGTYDNLSGINAAYVVDATNGAILATLSGPKSIIFAQPVFADDYLLVASVHVGLTAYRPGGSPSR